jgi:hypothetical protein
VGHDEKDCRAYDLMHERSKDAYRIQGELQQKGNVAQFNPQEEDTSTLVVGSEEEENEEAWVKVEFRLFSITTPNQVIWQGIVRTLVLLATIVICLIMSSKTV